MALRIDSEPRQSFFAAFDLRGTAQTGELSLFSPLGSTLAKMVWAPGKAEMSWNGQSRRFESIDALTREATGTELPIASLFRWLSGLPDDAGGWSADLSQLPDGKLVARRNSPAPAVEMRLILD